MGARKVAEEDEDEEERGRSRVGFVGAAGEDEQYFLERD